MALIKLNEGTKSNKRIALAIGLFDGLHLGHQELIKAVLVSKETPSILTFDKTNKKDIHGGDDVILSMKDKSSFAESLGIEDVYYLDFTNEVMSLSPAEFVKKYIEPLTPSLIVVGEDFRFGKGAIGTPKHLQDLMQDVTIKIIPTFKLSDIKISTTAIISYIRQGQIELANMMLGRSYQIKAKVIRGLHNGQTLGFPTANLLLEDNYVIPHKGVYATSIVIDGISYLSMTNIGTHPTIDELKDLSIEVNIFDFYDEIYGKIVTLDFLEFVRLEKKFETIEELQAELQRNAKYIQGKYRYSEY